MKTRIFIFNSFAIAFLSVTAWAYVVQDGDTLSKIAFKHVSSKVYGEDGSLKQLIALNPQIKNPDLIVVGENINLPNETLELVVFPSSPGLMPNRAPAIEALEVETSVEGYSLIEANPRFFYSRIDGSDSGSDAVLLSKLNYGLNLSWRQLWSETFETFVKLGVTKFEFTESASRTLEGKSFVQNNLEVGARLDLSESTKLGVSLGAGEEIFYRATTPTKVTIDSVMVPKLHLSIEQDVFSKKPFTLGVEAKVSLISSAQTDDYNINAGWGYVGRVYVEQEPKDSNFKVRAGVFYGQQFQNTSIVDLRRSDLGVDIGISWSFGK